MDRRVGLAFVLCFALGTSPAVAANAAPFDLRPIGMFAQSVTQTLPPEFAADLLIRIADSQAAVNGASRWRERLYEDAFSWLLARRRVPSDGTSSAERKRPLSFKRLLRPFRDNW